MKIEKDKIKMGIWYEDDEGHFLEADGDCFEPPKGAKTRHVSFPLEVTEEICEVKSDGTYKHPGIKCRTHIGGDGSHILAMANSGDYTLVEAIAVYANACERCANALIYKYTNGADGYPEDSDEYRNCNTYCDYCKDE